MSLNPSLIPDQPNPVGLTGTGLPNPLHHSGSVGCADVDLVNRCVFHTGVFALIVKLRVSSFILFI